MFEWPVCPIQGRQLQDVTPNDIVGDFRICKTYKSGGGYDQFPKIVTKRRIVTPDMLGTRDIQFVVQLRGCHLRCPYCYVTRDGVYGVTKRYSSTALASQFYKALHEHMCGVFHLMGGAPALYLAKWPELMDQVGDEVLFHSDLMLTESYYTVQEIEAINRPNALYAINIKGVTSKDYYENTGKTIDWKMFWHNFCIIRLVGLNFYVTFTAPDPLMLPPFKQELIKRFGEQVLEDSFIINLKQYEALKGGPAW